MQMQRLSSFGQSAARFYTQIVYCFPYNDRIPKKDTIQHLRTSLKFLEKQCPLLAGTLHISHDGNTVSVLPGGGGKIPVEVLITNGQQLAPGDSSYFDSYYSRLASRGFPPQAFVHPSLELNNKLKLEEEPIPVSHVRATFTPGGLLIWLSIHNKLGDSHCLGLFAKCFAAATRRQPIPFGTPQSPFLDIQADPVWSPATLMTLARECPEFDVLLYPGTSPSLPDSLPGGAPPGSIPKTGRIFIFSADRLGQMCSLVHRASGPGVRTPPVSACLAALTLAFVTQARLATEVDLVPGDDDDDDDDDDRQRTVKLITPVDWRGCRGLGGERTADYFGNAMITLVTRIPLKEVRDACTDGTMEALARLVVKIDTSVAGVDEEIIVKRNALFDRVGNCRRLLLRTDRRRPVELEFNMWRAMGADAVWDIPGVSSDQPHAVRKAQGDWSIGSALVLPARSDSRMSE